MGGNIRIEHGEEGTPQTRVVCYKALNDNGQYIIAEVDSDGAVTVEATQFRRICVTDWNRDGVIVLPDRIVSPGKSEIFQVGPHTVSIEGTPRRNVTFNGQPIKILTWEQNLKLYPPR